MPGTFPDTSKESYSTTSKVRHQMYTYIYISIQDRTIKPVTAIARQPASSPAHPSVRPPVRPSAVRMLVWSPYTCPVHQFAWASCIHSSARCISRLLTAQSPVRQSIPPFVHSPDHALFAVRRGVYYSTVDSLFDWSTVDRVSIRLCSVKSH